MIRVLVVEDAAVAGRSLAEELSRHPDVEVVGTAADAYAARERILLLRPDVLTLDVETSGMDPLAFLAKLMRHLPMPVVVVGSLARGGGEAALRALALGAVEAIARPGTPGSIPDVSRQLARAIRAAAVANVGGRGAGEAPAGVGVAPLARIHTTHQVIAIGASTGGTKALEVVLPQLPPTAPGTVVVQHMPEGFTASFAARLDRLCAVEVREARDGDRVAPGVVLIAPGNRHMLLERSGGQLRVGVTGGPPVHHQRPAADVLFRSVAHVVGRDAAGAVLTGMGADGARGLLEMRDAGAHTIAEDESTCVVYGMPREAIRLGAAVEVVPLPRVARALLEASGPARFPSAVV